MKLQSGKSCLVLSNIESLTSMQAHHVARYYCDDRNSRLYDETRRNLYLIVTDGLARSRLWPDYILYNGKLHHRLAQHPIPDDCEAHSVFGFCEYKPCSRLVDSKSLAMLVLEDTSEGGGK